MIPLKEAFRLLKDLPGFHTEDNTRERIKAGELPFEKVGGRGDIWVLGPAVHEKLGMNRDEANMTEDQKLIRHYEESDSNNYVTAMSLRLASTLTHAKRVYEEYLSGLQDPRVMAGAARREHESRLAHPETPCSVCHRTSSVGKEDSTVVTRSVTGERDIFNFQEEYVLNEFRNLRCPQCKHWRLPVPVERMQELISSTK